MPYWFGSTMSLQLHQGFHRHWLEHCLASLVVAQVVVAQVVVAQVVLSQVVAVAPCQVEKVCLHWPG